MIIKQHGVTRILEAELDVELPCYAVHPIRYRQTRFARWDIYYWRVSLLQNCSVSTFDGPGKVCLLVGKPTTSLQFCNSTTFSAAR